MGRRYTLATGWAVVFLLFAVPLLLSSVTQTFAMEWTDRVSVATDGSEGHNGADTPFWCLLSINADGRFVVFNSPAANYVPEVDTGHWDVFLRDRQTNETMQMSIASDGTQGNNWSVAADISADGRYVVFGSGADNLVVGDTNHVGDIFVRDRETGQTTRVSVASDGTEQNGGDVNWPCMSANGRYIGFYANATNLVSGDTNGQNDSFLHNRETGQTTRISVASDGTQGNGTSRWLDISADGRYVVFASDATNLVAGDTNGKTDVFLHDCQTGQTIRVSVASDGTQGNNNSGEAGPPSISADGRYVVFESNATNFVSGDTNGLKDIFLHDCQTGQTIRVSVASDGTQANNLSILSTFPAVSADGRYVTYESDATNLVEGDTNDRRDVFVHDCFTGETTRVSLANDGTQGNNRSLRAAISGDGQYITYLSFANNLVPGDTNGGFDVFVRTRWGFRDIFPSFWAYADVTSCVEAGIVQGYPDLSYRPTAIVTRGAMATYIARALSGGDALVPTGPSVATFTDVPIDNPYFRYVEYAVSEGVVQGYPDGSYRPTVQVNRGQMAIYIARALCGGEAYIPTGPAIPTFPDVAIDAQYYNHVEYIADPARAIASGYSDGTYRPAVLCRRDQMAAYVARAFLATP